MTELAFLGRIPLPPGTVVETARKRGRSQEDGPTAAPNYSSTQAPPTDTPFPMTLPTFSGDTEISFSIPSALDSHAHVHGQNVHPSAMPQYAAPSFVPQSDSGVPSLNNMRLDANRWGTPPDQELDWESFHIAGVPIPGINADMSQIPDLGLSQAGGSALLRDLLGGTDNASTMGNLLPSGSSGPVPVDGLSRLAPNVTPR